MHILIFTTGKIPSLKYGGTQRVVWALGKALLRQGHRVTYLAGSGSVCDFAPVLVYDPARPLGTQIPEGIDLVHLHQPLYGELVEGTPFVYTEHTNSGAGRELPFNTVFLSRDHAARHGSETFVYNGLDWDEYGTPDLRNARSYYHFLGNAAWRVKNVRGAIDVVRGMTGGRLVVLGGHRFNFKMGMRFTFSPKIRFAGIIAKTKSTSVFDRISRTNLEISTKLRVKTRVQKSTFAPWFFGMCLDKTIVLCYYGVLLTYTNLLPINN